MRVFITGATGWVGNVVVDELLGAGHEVHGLSRSEEKATVLAAKGAEVLRGTLDDLDRLAEAVAKADAVIHLAFNHDFSKIIENSEQERRAIEAMGAALVGTAKPLLVTSGLALLAPGRVATEADTPPRPHPHFPRKNQMAAAELAERGVRVGVVRLATTVHGLGDRQGFLALLAKLARETGVSAYLHDGANRWPAVHVSDAGRLYRLVLEAGVPARAYHATAEDVPFRAIAEAIGRAEGVPVESRPREHFGWFAGFAEADSPASSAHTRELTGWEPTGPSLLTDLAHTTYFAR
jgi:nucleoside-diphosphate-sugar epimerase